MPRRSKTISLYIHKLGLGGRNTTGYCVVDKRSLFNSWALYSLLNGIVPLLLNGATCVASRLVAAW